jgi:ADP-glucose type glycogen/starch synthase
MFHVDVGRFINREVRIYKQVLPDSRIHLAQDRAFYYRSEVYSPYYVESHRIALAFQREVMNNVIPHVNPDLIHCNDWTTGLLPAVARRMDIPSLFTIHNVYTQEMTLEQIEDSGIDAAEFWPYLYYARVPLDYDETRSSNQVNFLTSGIFSSHFVNTVSPRFLDEICEGRHGFVPDCVRAELTNKRAAGCAFGILNAPDPSYDPQTDNLIETNFSAENHVEGKRRNKVCLQERLGLIKDEKAPVLFWPSRLDPVQKGPQLLTNILYDTMSSYWDDNLQIIIVANGPYQQAFRDIVRLHDFHRRVAVCDFDEELSHMGYAASDFMLMPSLFEPCGLPQMIGAIYGSLPIVHDTGGLHDTVAHLNVRTDEGNGFVFETFDDGGLRWAVNQAIRFYHEPDEIKNRTIARVMMDSASTFTHAATARQYIDLYEKMLERPLVEPF